MSLSIANNVASLTAQNNLSHTNSTVTSSLQRLSTGLKINTGADGPSALVISQEQQAQITQLQTSIDSTNKAVSLVQTGEGALSQVSSLLAQARGLATASANADDKPNERVASQAQLTNILNTIDSIAKTTSFGTSQLLQGGTLASTHDGQFVVGSTVPVGGTAALSLPDVRVTGAGAGLGALSGLSVSSAGLAAQAVTAIDSAVAAVTSARNQLGAFQTKSLQAQATNLQSTLTNTTAAESVVRDTDYASEVANFTKTQVQLQSGASVLSNATQVPALISKLLRG